MKLPNCTIYTDIQQRTGDWYKLRAGRLTASNMSRLLTPTGKKPSPRSNPERGAWGGLILELTCDFLVLDDPVFEGNKFTERGLELEPEAREVFEAETGETVHEVGFILADDGVAGCSPDGLILDKDGNIRAGLEIKCPLAKKHAENMLDASQGKIPAEYAAQIHGSMAITGIREWYFMSYHPELKSFIMEIHWGEYTDKLAAALAEFKGEYKRQFAELVKLLRK